MFTKPNMFFFCLCSFCGFLFQLQVSQAQSPLTQNVTAVEGGTVTLTCKVDQNDNTSLQWSNPAQQTLYFDDKKALRDNRIELVRSSWQELSINISEVALSDEGQYTCSLFTMPVKTSKAFLTVLGVPQTPVISGFKGPFNEGDLVELTCSTSGSKPAADIRWFKDEKEMKDIPSIKESNGKTFTVSSKMGLRVDRNDDGVAVSCTVDHVSLKASPQVATQVLNIQYMPSVKIDFSRNFAREGDELRLECRVTGNPTPEAVKWKKDGAELPDPDRMVVEGNMLIISALNKTDNGTYYCEASNLLGENTAEYILFVYDPSALAGQTGTDHAMIGGVVAVVVFVTLCLIIVLGRYLARHKGTYLTNEAKGAEDAPDADTAIINAEGSQANADEKKEYFI
ncbi:cell adhesion molecule 2b isoform X3 [Callorhinchus milii]|uniref:cell adhesion molecule 2b isoform X3 n=1 Tax=Callorhinchus milii TaxID=7868 RepID=UPI0004571F47|nr:cell adhesion molecule 2b isoform X3 [Callorhinchus milii]|eukprot:gi/632970640/ref/XP_007901763.1/ PREDICTED: cell adhesion molecule 2 isoform X3 [Callorhinchus milii]